VRRFDTDANGVITFDEFVAMHQKFPLLLWPLFQLQDRMQSRSLGRAAWTTIGRRDAKMRQVNQTMLRSKDAALAAAPGLARGEAADPSAAAAGGSGAAAGGSGAAAASASGMMAGGSLRADSAAPSERSMGDAVSPKSVTATGARAPGQRLAGGDMSGLAMKAMTTSKSSSKGKGSRSKSGGGSRRR
jgi:hypothetical protein